MKKILTLIISGLLITGMSANSQTVLPVDSGGKVQIEEVISVDSADAKALYSRAVDWFIKTFTSAKDVIQNRDADRATIIGKGRTRMIWPTAVSTTGYLTFTLAVAAKDGSYRYTFSDLAYQDGGFSNPPVPINSLIGKKNKVAEKARRNAMEEISAIAASLKEAMQKNDEW